MCRVQGYLESRPEFPCYTLQNPGGVTLSFNCKHLLHIIASLISVFLYIYSVKVPKVLILWGTSVHCTTIMSTQNKTGDTSTYYSIYILVLPCFLEFLRVLFCFVFWLMFHNSSPKDQVSLIQIFCISLLFSFSALQYFYLISSIFVSGIPNYTLFPPDGSLNIDLCLFPSIIFILYYG